MMMVVVQGPSRNNISVPPSFCGSSSKVFNSLSAFRVTVHRDDGNLHDADVVGVTRQCCCKPDQLQLDSKGLFNLRTEVKRSQLIVYQVVLVLMVNSLWLDSTTFEPDSNFFEFSPVRQQL